jgi:hypothetical protein
VFSKTCLSPVPTLSQNLRRAREFVAHFSFEDMKNHFEADMNTGIGDTVELLD